MNWRHKFVPVTGSDHQGKENTTSIFPQTAPAWQRWMGFLSWRAEWRVKPFGSCFLTWKPPSSGHIGCSNTCHLWYSYFKGPSYLALECRQYTEESFLPIELYFEIMPLHVCFSVLHLFCTFISECLVEQRSLLSRLDSFGVLWKTSAFLLLYY